MSAPVIRLRAPAAQPDAPLSDEAIARACAAGDATAIAELFDRFQSPVTRYVSRLVGGGADVEDLVQSTFLEIARGTAAYDGRASVRTWLFAIATNIVRHHRRSTARRFRLLSAFGAEPASAPAQPDVQTDGRRNLERARAALAALGDDLREAFVLCDLEGLSARDAGAILGVSEAAVWKRASRAREQIREKTLGEERR